jgi:hypothetical protein
MIPGAYKKIGVTGRSKKWNRHIFDMNGDDLNK